MPRPKLAGYVVLVAEDDDAQLRAIVKQLREWGATALPAHSVDEAMHRVKQRPDVLIADVMLGDDDGVELARDLVSMLPGLRVVLTSGDTDTLMHRALEGWTFLPKPWWMCDLCETLAAVLATNGRT